MVLRGYIIEWNATAPWSDMHQVEQDLIISRVLVAVYNDEFLLKRLAFRGGTAIHRLFITPQTRYSEDIDLVQIESGPIGSTLDRLREVLSFLGNPTTQRKASNNKVIYKMQSTFPPEVQLKLKIEINCQEHFSLLGYKKLPYGVKNDWFSGDCELTTFDFNELLGTKMRALYQRRKGRDLLDLYIATSSHLLDTAVVVDCFKRYMEFSVGRVPPRMEYLRNLEEKMKVPQFIKDTDEIIRPGFDYDPFEAFEVVKEVFIDNL